MINPVECMINPVECMINPVELTMFMQRVRQINKNKFTIVNKQCSRYRGPMYGSVTSTVYNVHFDCKKDPSKNFYKIRPDLDRGLTTASVLCMTCGTHCLYPTEFVVSFLSVYVRAYKIHPR